MSFQVLPDEGVWQRSKYLVFENDQAVEASRKTEYVNVRSRHGGLLLGTIRWYGPWRCYVFYPESHTLFNANCMYEIAAKERSMMADWFAQRAASA